MKRSRSPRPRPPRATALAAGAALLLCSCSSPAQETSGTAAEASSVGGTDNGHGHVDGAQEIAEPALSLVLGGASTPPRLLDLITEEESALPFTRAALGLSGEGRFVAATTGSGAELVDTGRWSWDHGDHFHYYTADARALGTLEGRGPVTVHGGVNSMAGGTAVLFPEEGRAVLLENETLAHSSAPDARRYEVAIGAGELLPLDGTRALAAGGDGSEAGLRDRAVVLDADGAPTGVAAACTRPSGAAVTRAGAVIGCEEGAIIATERDGEVTLTLAGFPEGSTAARPQTLSQRKGRTALAGPAGDTGFWLLDVRRATWSLHPTDDPVTQAVAADDADGHVLTLDAKGRVAVYTTGSDSTTSDAAPEVTSSSGAIQPARPVATTRPLAGVSDDVPASPTLQVDAHRAYLNDPATGRVFELDYADGARLARTLTPADGALTMHEVGR